MGTLGAFIARIAGSVAKSLAEVFVNAMRTRNPTKVEKAREDPAHNKSFDDDVERVRDLQRRRAERDSDTG